MTNSCNLIVRPLTTNDSACLARLLGQLGYPNTTEQVAQRFAQQQKNSMNCLLVAEIDRVAVGFLGMHLIPLCHMDGHRGRVTALIVDNAWRGRGVGTALLHEDECWAVQQGCTCVEITSGD